MKSVKNILPIIVPAMALRLPYSFLSLFILRYVHDHCNQSCLHSISYPSVENFQVAEKKKTLYFKFLYDVRKVVSIHTPSCLESTVDVAFDQVLVTIVCLRF